MREDKKLPFKEHLRELRQRIIISLLATGFFFILSYIFSVYIIEFLLRPLLNVLPKGEGTIFLGPTEGFFIYIKVSLIFGIFIAAPIIIWEAWAFIAPGLYEKERKYILPFLIFLPFLFILGALIGYLFILPIILRFFIGFSDEFIKPLLSINNYLTFSAKFLAIMGIIFEIPIVSIFLTKIGIIDPVKLSKNRKYAILIIFIISAIVTPPDIASQIIMSIPFIIIYEISIVLSRIFRRD